MPYKNKTRKMKGGKIPMYNDNFFVFDGTYSVIYKNHYIFKTNVVDTITLSHNYEYLESTPEEIQLADQNLEKEKFVDLNFEKSTVFKNDNIDITLNYINSFELLGSPGYNEELQERDLKAENFDMDGVFNYILNCKERDNPAHKKFIESLSDIFLISNENGKYVYSDINGKHNLLSKYSFIYKLKPLIEILLDDTFDVETNNTNEMRITLIDKIIDMFPPIPHENLFPPPSHVMPPPPPSHVMPPPPPPQHKIKQKTKKEKKLVDEKTKKEKKLVDVPTGDYNSENLIKWMEQENQNSSFKFNNFIDIMDMMKVYSSYTNNINKNINFEDDIKAKYGEKMKTKSNLKDRLSDYLISEANDILKLKTDVFDYLKKTTLHYDSPGTHYTFTNKPRFWSDPVISKDIALDLRGFLILFYIYKRSKKPILAMNGRHPLYPISIKLFIESLFNVPNMTEHLNHDISDFQTKYPKSYSMRTVCIIDNNKFIYSECAGRGLFEVFKFICAGDDLNFHKEYLPDDANEKIKQLFDEYRSFEKMTKDKKPDVDKSFFKFTEIINNVSGLHYKRNEKGIIYELASPKFYEYLYYFLNNNFMPNGYDINHIFDNIKNPNITITPSNDKLILENKHFYLTLLIGPGHTTTSYIEKKSHSTKIYINNKTLRYLILTNKGIDDSINSIQTTNVTNMNMLFYIDFVRIIIPNNISSWDVSNVKDMSQMFVFCERFNEPLDSWNVENVENMSSMFKYCSSFNQPLNNWKVENVKNMNQMFKECKSFNQPLDGWNVENVTDMEEMFRACKLFNQPLNSWNVKNVTTMDHMFKECKSFDQPLNRWNVQNVKTMGEMFKDCVFFNQPLGHVDAHPGWNVSNVTDMTGMFQGCENFNQPLNSWIVSNVTSTFSMFQGCEKFNQPLDNWNVSNVIYMNGMFKNCKAFNQPLKSWNVSNVPNMLSMFEGCENFNQPLDSWDVSNVESMTAMFKNCKNFNQPLNSWKIQNKTSTFMMFHGCINMSESNKPNKINNGGRKTRKINKKNK